MIIKISDDLLSSSVRGRRWAKVIQTADSINLHKKGGYAFTSEFAHWAEAVAIQTGEYLVVAAERNGYQFRLYFVEHNKLELVPDNEVDGVVGESELPEPWRVAAMNSRLYAYAAYCYLKLREAGLYRPKERFDDTSDRLLGQVFGDRS